MLLNYDRFGYFQSPLNTHQSIGREMKQLIMSVICPHDRYLGNWCHHFFLFSHFSVPQHLADWAAASSYRLWNVCPYTLPIFYDIIFYELFGCNQWLLLIIFTYKSWWSQSAYLCHLRKGALPHEPQNVPEPLWSSPQIALFYAFFS